MAVKRKAGEATLKNRAAGRGAVGRGRASARKLIKDGGSSPHHNSFTDRFGHLDQRRSPPAGNLLRGQAPRLGTYIEGELGIRHEDVITITEDGAENLTRWSGSPEEPVAV